MEDLGTELGSQWWSDFESQDKNMGKDVVWPCIQCMMLCGHASLARLKGQWKLGEIRMDLFFN